MIPLLITLYILGGISFCLWDACVGWGVDFDGTYNPPLGLVTGLWFISVPILLIYNFVRLCNYLKVARVERQKKEEKQRIQNEKLAAIEAKKRAKEIEDAYLELEADAALAEEINNLRNKK